jgi:hypothetical protein
MLAPMKALDITVPGKYQYTKAIGAPPREILVVSTSGELTMTEFLGFEGGSR